MSIERITELLETLSSTPTSSPIPVVDHVIGITIVNVAASQTDTITIGGVACEFESDANPTIQEVSDGLIAAIAASAAADSFYVTQGAGPTYDIRLQPRLIPQPAVTVSANLSEAEITVEHWGPTIFTVLVSQLGAYYDWILSQPVVLRSLKFQPSAAGDYLSIKEVVPGVSDLLWPETLLKPTTADPVGCLFNSGKRTQVKIVYSLCSFATPEDVRVTFEYA